MARLIPIMAVAALIAAGGFAAAPHAVAQDRLSQARDACAAAGLNPSEAPYAYCVQAADRPYAVPADDNMAQARIVCGRMGYTGESYTACVGNVDQTLFDQQNFLTR